MTAKIHYQGPWQIATRATDVLCSDGIRRTVILAVEPDTFFTIPGKVQVKGKTVTGFIVHCGDGNKDIQFHAYQNGKNGHLLP